MGKKKYVEVRRVAEFIDGLGKDVIAEYRTIINRLEAVGYLTAPFGEKVERRMFAIRVVKTANVRVFYVYGFTDKVYGIHGYIKKTEKIPACELATARKAATILRQGGLIP